MKRKLFILTLGLLTIGAADANPMLIKAKRYLDVKSGEYKTPANLLVDGDKIIAINPNKLPQDTKILSKPKMTLLPGLMDMHVHIVFDFNKNYMLEYVQTDAAKATLIGVKNAKKLLNAGFTTVRDVGQIYPGLTFVDVALAKASEKGEIDAPHIIPAGHALSITGGHMDPSMVGHYRQGTIQTSYKIGVADGVDEVVKAVRYQIKYGAQVIKAGATAGVLSLENSVGAQQYSYQELKAMVDEAARHDVFVAVHAHGTEGIKQAVKAGVRSVEHGSLIDDEGIRLMKEHGTYLVPTSYVGKGVELNHLHPKLRQKAQWLFPLRQKALRRAIEQHVKIAFGTDTPVFPHGQNAKEFSALVDLGMTPIEAIRTSTINAADMMKLQDRGQIKKGMLADVIGVYGDPMKDVRVLEHVALVMKSGHMYKS